MDKRKTYEAMFLLDAGNPDFEAIAEPVRKILGRYEAEVLSLKPWDERKLAYEIEGRKRGVYLLTYFKVDPLKVTEIEHDCRLDERVLRALILRRDTLTEEEINAETPATASARRATERRVAREAEEGEAGEVHAEEAADAPVIEEEAEEEPEASDKD